MIKNQLKVASKGKRNI